MVGGGEDVDFMSKPGQLTGVVIADIASASLIGREGSGDMGDAQYLYHLINVKARARQKRKRGSKSSLARREALVTPVWA